MVVGRKKNGAWTARWVYGAGLGPVAELDADGYVAKRFVYGSHANVPDYVVTLTRTTTTTLESVAAVVHDRRGGVRELIAMTDSLSPVHTTYDEYGRISDPNPVNVGVSVPFGFAGGMFDPETGLVHLGAREYDPQTGRWLTPDPIGFAGGPNLYGYVLADPINYIDPLGWSAEDIIQNPRPNDPNFSLGFKAAQLGIPRYYVIKGAIYHEKHAALVDYYENGGGATKAWKNFAIRMYGLGYTVTSRLPFKIADRLLDLHGEKSLEHLYFGTSFAGDLFGAINPRTGKLMPGKFNPYDIIAIKNGYDSYNALADKQGIKRKNIKSD